MGIWSFAQVIATYDTVAADYAARFPTTEPEDPLDLSAGMVAIAGRDHRDVAFGVGSITDLPYADASFDAAMYWFSVIHSPAELLPRIASEAARVVRPGGHVLLAFQVGSGSRDVANSYRALGHDVSLTCFDRTVPTTMEVSSRPGSTSWRTSSASPCLARRLLRASSPVSARLPPSTPSLPDVRQALEQTAD